MDAALLEWYIIQTRRVGDRQALELLTAALGIDRRALPYIAALD
jgi:hypothetical protein